MSTPVFQPYTPGINDDVNSKIKGLTNAYADVVQQLQWVLQHLDSANVTKLNTSRTVIRSNAGETTIDGPLLVMKDKQGTPVIRLLMGYDSASLDFVYQLMNAAGDITVDIDSSGNLTVERGTFKGSITIGTGNNVFKADGATGIWLGHADFASAPFKVGIDGAATATNLTVTGGTIRTAAVGNDRIEITSSGLISYNSSNQKSGVAIEDGSYSYGAVDFYHAGVKVGTLYYDTFGGMHFSALGGAIMNPEGTWDCSGATFTTLTDGVSNYITQSYADSHYEPAFSGATGSFTTADGKTVTVAGGVITNIV